MEFFKNKGILSASFAPPLVSEGPQRNAASGEPLSLALHADGAPWSNGDCEMFCLSFSLLNLLFSFCFLSGILRPHGLRLVGLRLVLTSLGLSDYCMPLSVSTAVRFLIPSYFILLLAFSLGRLSPSACCSISLHCHQTCMIQIVHIFHSSECPLSA